jgi:hypothetical protein
MGCRLRCGDISNVIATQNGKTANLECFATIQTIPLVECPKKSKEIPYIFNKCCLEESY